MRAFLVIHLAQSFGKKTKTVLFLQVNYIKKYYFFTYTYQTPTFFANNLHIEVRVAVVVTISVRARRRHPHVDIERTRPHVVVVEQQQIDWRNVVGQRRLQFANRLIDVL